MWERGERETEEERDMEGERELGERSPFTYILAHSIPHH